MIAHFALMGELYQYDPYSAEASLWNSYPWHLGADNGIDVSAKIPVFTMAKMIWDIDDSDSSIGASNATLGEFGMFASLILMDSFGNLGSDSGKLPQTFKPNFTTQGGEINSMSSVATLIFSSVNDQSNILSTQGGEINSMSTFEVLVISSVNDQSNILSTQGGEINSMSTFEVLVISSVNDQSNILSTQGGEINSMSSSVV